MSTSSRLSSIACHHGIPGSVTSQTSTSKEKGLGALAQIQADHKSQMDALDNSIGNYHHEISMMQNEYKVAKLQIHMHDKEIMHL